MRFYCFGFSRIMSSAWIFAERQWLVAAVRNVFPMYVNTWLSAAKMRPSSCSQVRKLFSIDSFVHIWLLEATTLLIAVWLTMCFLPLLTLRVSGFKADIEYFQVFSKDVSNYLDETRFYCLMLFSLRIPEYLLLMSLLSVKSCVIGCGDTEMFHVNLYCTFKISWDGWACQQDVLNHSLDGVGYYTANGDASC